MLIYWIYFCLKEGVLSETLPFVEGETEEWVRVLFVFAFSFLFLFQVDMN